MRKKFKAIRKKITANYRQKAGLKAIQLIADHPLFKENNEFGLYLSTKTEFPTEAMITAIWENKKKCYVPSIQSNKSKELLFIPYHQGDELEPNHLNILEPKQKRKPKSIKALDIVILPLLAFDRMGHRLGTGGGYFDVTFSFLKEAYLNKPFMLGLGFSKQEADFLPFDEWDIAMDAILTEKELIRCLIC